MADGASDEAVKLASQLSTAIDSNEKLPKNLYPNSESKNSTSLHSLFEENLDSPKFTTPGIVSIPNVESCDEFKKKGFSNQYLVDCIRLLAGRVDTVEEIAKSAKYLFETPQRVVFDSQKDLEILEKLSSLFSTTNSIDIHQVRSIISDTSSALNMKESRVRKVCRMALTGTSMGAAIDETILVLGLAECIKRFFRCVRDFHSGS